MKQETWAALAALAVVLTAAAVISLVLALAPEHPLQDMTHYKLWAAHVTAGGVAAAYTGTYPETFVLYPPLLVYVYRFAGWAAALWPAPPVPLPGDWLSLLIKLPAIGFHLATAGLLYWGVRGFGGEWRALAAAAVYAWNPGVLLNVAYWGQPDSVHSFLLVAALLAFVRRHAGLAWAALTLAALAKPQTWIFVPVFAWLTLRQHDPLTIGRALLLSAAAGAAVLFPWIEAQRLQDVTALLGAVSRIMPSISANAHNAWWIVLPQEARVIFNTDPAWGPFSYRTLGAMGFAVAYVFALLRLTGPTSQRLLASVCGFISLAFFSTSTQMHENHLFQAIPLLALAWPASAPHALLYLGISWTFLLNVLLHDFAVGPHVAALIETQWPGFLATDLQVINAKTNLLLLGLWAALLVVLPLARMPSSAERRQAARTVLLWSAPAASVLLGAGLALLSGPAILAAVATDGVPALLNGTPAASYLLRLAEVFPDLLAARWRDYAQALYALPFAAAVVGAESLLFAVTGLVVAAIQAWREGLRIRRHARVWAIPGPSR